MNERDFISMGIFAVVSSSDEKHHFCFADIAATKGSKHPLMHLPSTLLYNETAESSFVTGCSKKILKLSDGAILWDGDEEVASVVLKKIVQIRKTLNERNFSKKIAEILGSERSNFSVMYVFAGARPWKASFNCQVLHFGSYTVTLAGTVASHVLREILMFAEIEKASSASELKNLCKPGIAGLAQTIVFPSLIRQFDMGGYFQFLSVSPKRVVEEDLAVLIWSDGIQKNHGTCLSRSFSYSRGNRKTICTTVSTPKVLNTLLLHFCGPGEEINSKFQVDEMATVFQPKLLIGIALNSDGRTEIVVDVDNKSRFLGLSVVGGNPIEIQMNSKFLTLWRERLQKAFGWNSIDPIEGDRITT